MSDNKYTPVSTQPVKRFFVEMLTRDIAVEDAILDLLDNCVDGILRSKSLTLEQATPMESETPVSISAENTLPYTGFWANIKVNGDRFEIQDNCGGIPWKEHDRAFRMGRPLETPERPEDIPALSVGAYGIGMKRAIFRMGTQALISTQNGGDNYEIDISPEWIRDESNWHLDVKQSEYSMDHDGTLIIVEQLHTGVRERFSAEIFERDLITKIESHYAVIIQKGFAVTVNNQVIDPNPIQFRFAVEKRDGAEVRPYMFRSNIADVDIFLAIGLREPIPGVERMLEEQTSAQFSSDFAGWTVICNDRVVLYNNRDELTGWGTAGIPQYHTQFIAISGVVEFRGDPRQLPTTTTKRGLDFSSSIYQQVLDRMREGLRMFVSFTNQWKTHEEEARAEVSPVPSVTYSALRRQVEAANIPFAQVRIGRPGEQYKPSLPQPISTSTAQRITYIREKDELRKLAEEILPDFDDLQERDIPRRVGEETFNFTYKHFFDGDVNK